MTRQPLILQHDRKRDEAAKPVGDCLDVGRLAGRLPVQSPRESKHDDGETVLYWDLLPRDAKRVVTMLRTDLETMEAREFFERWASFEGDADIRH